MEQYLPSPDAARTPPNHPVSERSVLGAMLRSKSAAQIAVESVRAYLKAGCMERIVFCVHGDENLRIYQKLLY